MDFENLLLDLGIQGCLYEPEYSQEELTQIEQEAAAAAAEQAFACCRGRGAGARQFDLFAYRH